MIVSGVWLRKSAGWRQGLVCLKGGALAGTETSCHRPANREEIFLLQPLPYLGWFSPMRPLRRIPATERVAAACEPVMAAVCAASTAHRTAVMERGGFVRRVVGSFCLGCFRAALWIAHGPVTLRRAKFLPVIAAERAFAIWILWFVLMVVLMLYERSEKLLGKKVNNQWQAEGLLHTGGDVAWPDDESAIQAAWFVGRGDPGRCLGLV